MGNTIVRRMALPGAVLGLMLLASCGGDDKSDTPTSSTAAGGLSGSASIPTSAATSSVTSAAGGPGAAFNVAPAGVDACTLLTADAVQRAFPPDAKLDAPAKTADGSCTWAVTGGAGAGLTVAVQKGESVQIAFES